MREILYLQAGKLANYTGTHFWNAQETYLQTQESDIDPCISFCESIDAQNRSTLCPRLIVFDHRSNFGTLGSSNALGAEDGAGIEPIPALWNGELVEYKQELIAKSGFQSSLEEDCPDQTIVNEEIRYWSDFNRLYYLPRTLQKIPNPPEWETTGVDLNQGQEVFTRFNEETELMDGTFRLFVEDCDNIQGLQVINDSNTFGSYMDHFFTSFRDEYPKLASFCFPILSGAPSDHNEITSIRRLVNEAMYLRTLNELSSMNVPIEDPKRWPESVWGAPLNFASTSLYHQSAILSTHVESTTLPFRLNHCHHDIPSVSGFLNWRGTSPFAELGGLFPFTEFTKDIVNFSNDASTKSPHARWDVTRGLDPNSIGDYRTWSSQTQCVKSSVHGSAYPLPNSFPNFNHLEGIKKKKNSDTIQVYSSLSSSSNTSNIFQKYAVLIDGCVKRRSNASIDLPLDELRELSNDLWTMHDNSVMEMGDS